MSKDKNEAKKGGGNRKKLRNYRHRMPENWEHRMGAVSTYSKAEGTRYMRSGGPQRALKRKILRMTKRIEWQAKRAAINEQKRFAHTAARTAQRWMAAEPIYPLR